MHGPVVTSFNVDDKYSFSQSGKFDAEEEEVSWSYYKSGVLKQDQRPDTPKLWAQKSKGDK